MSMERILEFYVELCKPMYVLNIQPTLLRGRFSCYMPRWAKVT